MRSTSGGLLACLVALAGCGEVVKRGVDAAAPADADLDQPDAVSLPSPDAASVCGEAQCTPAAEAFVSHFTELGCTGLEHYWTSYFSSDGVARSWDGLGLVGTTLVTVTNKSFKNAEGICQDAWPGGNTLSDFVRVYR